MSDTIISNILVYTKQFKTKGNLVYEYNPLYNYRINKVHYVYKNTLYTEDELTEFLKQSLGNGALAYDNAQKKYTWNGKEVENLYKFEPGQLTNFETSELDFSINHPISILPQYSYDGSVNLILNDGKSFPKLINSRFSAREKNTYEIVDRSGNDDTNIYDLGIQFNTDVSLFKLYLEIPKINFLGAFSGGYMPVGNYFFYFKYADADGNETDFVGESGLVSLFIGNTNTGTHTGLMKLSSNKLIKFSLTNIDSAYSKCVVYGVRNSGTLQGVHTTEAFKIIKDYTVNKSGFCNIIITGLEDRQDISIAELNVNHVTVEAAATLAIAKNRLFLGNVKLQKIPQQELADLALHFTPKLAKKDYDVQMDYNYTIISKETGYYDTKYIYNYVGYWDEEYYRLGVVYIMKDNSLSDVFNIRGHSNLTESTSYKQFKVYEDNKRKYITFDSQTNKILDEDILTEENSKGVVYVNAADDITDQIIYFLISINEKAMEELTNYVKGFFFVRLKRIPTTLAQAFTIGVDKESGVPLIGVGSESNIFTPTQLKVFDAKFEGTNDLYLAERFLDNDRVLTHTYLDRLYPIAGTDLQQFGAFCPDYDVDYPYLNAYLTGDKNAIKYAKSLPKNAYFTQDTANERHYYNIEYELSKESDYILYIPVIGIQDNAKLMAVKDYKFSARAGMGEEAFLIGYLKSKNKTKEATNLVRSSYGPFIGLGSNNIKPGKLIDIKIPNYDANQHETYMSIRFEDTSPYYAISERYSIKDVLESSILDFGTFRGDCYICLFTHRVNRNFLDSTSPTNDIVIDSETWKTNYSVTKPEDLNKINLGDVNAIKMGNWVTFRVRSSKNLNIRTLDEANIDETTMFGHPRGFYPQLEMSEDGMYKMPEALIYNKGFEVSVGNQANYTTPEVPYLKNNFETRIMYSELNINDSFQNGFRVFNISNYVDYPRTYGGIVKLMELDDDLLCIFEHGVALIPILERVLSGEGANGNVFINTNKVLPNTLTVLSDKFGSQWVESVIKTDSYVYGVDTVAKKIWRTDGSTFEVISDLKIQKFLIDHISLKERENYPIIGIRNVKTHYNAHKNDVMFTFYDNLYGHQEEVWNICFNELLNKWITFYSWIPSYSENIDNMHFSFDRNTSKKIAKLGISKANNDFSNGIVLSNNVVDSINKGTSIGTLSHTEDLNIITHNLNGQKIGLSYELCKSPYNILDYFTITTANELKALKNIHLKQDKFKVDANNVYLDTDIIYLNIALKDSESGTEDTIYSRNTSTYLQSTVAISTTECVNKLTTDFWKHGQGGIIDIKDTIKPTFWYGKQHPFEFEFIALDNIHLHKIFTNLMIVSNKTAPESFHYEIVGECYAFNHAKKNAFIRLEMTNHLYQILRSRREFNLDYMKLSFDKDVVKSVKFPLYYLRINSINDIEDAYILATSPSKDYSNLSGTEVIYYEDLNEFRLVNHSKAVDIANGRIRGNMQYNEDKWEIKLNPIIFEEKNENLTDLDKLPLVIDLLSLPKDIQASSIQPDDVEELKLNNRNYTLHDVQIQDKDWTLRKEVRPKDKYIKIKIRYSGEDLAIINMIKTIYTVSYG